MRNYDRPTQKPHTHPPTDRPTDRRTDRVIRKLLFQKKDMMHGILWKESIINQHIHISCTCRNDSGSPRLIVNTSVFSFFLFFLIIFLVERLFSCSCFLFLTVIVFSWSFSWPRACFLLFSWSFFLVESVFSCFITFLVSFINSHLRSRAVHLNLESG